MNRLAVLILTATLSLNAQQPLTGLVEDSSGAPVAKATLTLLRVGSGEKRTASAGTDGSFLFDGLADGEYTLRAEAKQLSTVEQTVRVTGAPLAFRLTLNPEARIEKVEVIAVSSKVSETMVSMDRNADRLNFDEDLIDALPAESQNVLSVASGFLSSAAQGAEGMSVTVDGVETSASSLPASAIRRIRLNRNPYAPQFRRPGKARLEAYTEEGSVSRYRGGFGIAVRNSLFDARNAFAPVRPDSTRSLVDFNLSIPVSRKRSSVYFNGEHYRNNEMAVVNAVTLNGPLTANVPTPERRTRLLGRYEIRGELHQITAQYSFLDQSEQNRGVGGLHLAEQGISASDRAQRMQFSDRVLLFGKVLNDLRIVVAREETERGSSTALPAIEVQGAFTGGAPQSFRFRGETSARIQNASSLSLGGHILRFGVEAKPASFDTFERSNFGGTYEFANLDAFSVGRSLLYSINRGNPSVSFRQHEAYGYVQDDVTLAKRLSLTYGVRYGWQSDIDDFNNFASRLGFAYSPGSNGTVIRGGAGFFHERVTEDVNRRSLLWDGVHLQEFIYENAPYPLPTDSASTPPPPSIIRRSELVAPLLLQFSLGVEQSIGRRTTVAAEYQRLRGSHLLRSRNVNAPILGIRPTEAFLNINQVESTAAMRGESFALTLRGGAGKRLSGMLQYTISRTEDDTSGPFSLPANSYDLRPEWGRSDYDQRHRMHAAATLDLSRGFRAGTVVSLASGAPYNVTTGRDNNGDTIVNDRPVGIARNAGMGPGLARIDLRLTKLIRAPRFLDRGREHSSRNVELSVDLFNVLNHTNYAGYVGVVTSPFFGLPNTALAPRTIQFSLRYKL